MKKFIYFIAFITLLASLTSCTADELQPVKKTEPTSISAKDGDFVPPIIIKP